MAALLREMRSSCQTVFRRVPQFAQRGLSSGRSSAATQHATADVTPAAQSKAPLSRVRGTRDFQPADLRLRDWSFDHWRSVALLHGWPRRAAALLFLSWSVPMAVGLVCQAACMAGHWVAAQCARWRDRRAGGARCAPRGSNPSQQAMASGSLALV